MARPKNIVVTVGNTIYSVSPKNLRTYLSSRMKGQIVSLEGKALGSMWATGLEAMTATDAEQLLQKLGPEASEGVDISTLPSIE